MRWSVRRHGPVATRIHVMGNSQLAEANDRARRQGQEWGWVKRAKALPADGSAI